MVGRGLLPARICRDTQEEEQEPCLEGTSPPDVPCQEKGRADGFFLANFNVLRKPLSGRGTQHSVLCVLINSEDMHFGRRLSHQVGLPDEVCGKW